MIRKLIALLLISTQAFAGLPPTSSKVSSDSVDVTTFKYQFPNFTGTHTGTALSLGINSVAGGGTGLGTLTANNVILGNGASAVTFVAPGTSGNVLTSNGTTWTSAAAAGVSSWAAFTPTFAGFGTVSNVKFEYRQIGDALDIRGYFTSGTSTAVLPTMTLPTGNLNTTILDGGAGLRSNLCDYARLATTTGINATSRMSGYLTAYSGTIGTDKLLFQADSATSTFNTTNANSLFSSGEIITVKCFGIPII